MAKNGTLWYASDSGDEIPVTKGKFVTQEALAEFQKIQRAEKKYKDKAKLQEAKRKELEALFVQAHLAGKRSARGEDKLLLEVKESTSTSISWKTEALALAEELGKDVGKYEKDLVKANQKTTHKVKVI